MLNRYGFVPILGISRALGLEWLERMSEPHRHYHTVAHVLDIIQLSQNFMVEGSLAYRNIFAAAWLHDIIYDPRSSTNEEDSADYASACLRGSLVDPDEIAQMILATKSHRAEGSWSQLFCDLDMAIVASPPPVYDAYSRAIRREYEFVPEPLYRSKRAEVLRKFNESTIFQTSLMSNYEQDAHDNIAREISSLES